MATPAPPPTFAQLGLAPWLVQALSAVNIRQPTEIQANCIGPILRGRDVIGSAQTGSGKTAAFALPILQKFAEDPFGVYAVVLTPTRELAYQIADQFKVYGRSVNLRVSVIVGGVDMMVQMRELATRPHIVVATPGRLADALDSCTDAASLKKAKFLVLDEADRMLESTFADDLATILKALPAKRQTLLFSATMSRSLEKLRALSMNDPFVFHAAAKYDTVEKLSQHYVFIPRQVKEVYLVYLLLNQLAGKSAIIFTGRCRTCEILYVMLRELDIEVTALHSGMSQADRIASLGRFRSGYIKTLLATDVGSRGLDIPQVEVVLNFDVPSAPRDYVHRVGRTARAGRGGEAITIITERDIELVQAVEAKIGKQLTELPLNESDVLKLLNKVSAAHKAAVMHVLESKFDEKRALQKRRKRSKDAEQEDGEEEEDVADEDGNSDAASNAKRKKVTQPVDASGTSSGSAGNKKATLKTAGGPAAKAPKGKQAAQPK